MALEDGQILCDRYRIESRLSRGGMGVVYCALDLRLGVPVAVKEMAPPVELGEERKAQLREQFRTEARTLARLNHPHLVRVTDWFSVGKSEYLVMDFAEGTDLARWIQETGPLPEEQVLVWAGQLLDALAYCHRNHVYHRDVKPHNVIIDRDGRAMLVDFGLVKSGDAADQHTRAAIRGMGTPEYAPPEQVGASSEHTDARSDIYSLGATLYHMLTGRAPPSVTKRWSDPELLRPIREVAPGVSRRTQAVVTKALELVRRDRWQSAQEMADALGVSGPLGLRQQAWGPLPGSPEDTVKIAAPPFFGARGSKRRRNWMWAALGAFVIVTLGGLWLWRSSEAGIRGAATPLPAPAEVARATATVVETVPATPTPEPSPALVAAATLTPPASASPTRRPTHTATPPPQPTPTYTLTRAEPSATTLSAQATPTSTSAPAAPPTLTPTPTFTPTPPATPTSPATATPAATATSTPRWLAAPLLLAPPPGASFVGWNAQVILQWSSAGSLRSDEYYVVRIPYDAAGNTAEFWRKELSLQVPPHFSGYNVGFADRHYDWTVQPLRCAERCSEVLDDNVRKSGVAVGNPSAQGLFYWHPGIPGKPTNTPPP